MKTKSLVESFLSPHVDLLYICQVYLLLIIQSRVLLEDI